ncbi:MAG: hypothetical protein JW958_02290 [Candidatus Eisenbacteria bacterium]|nr:hypothetical protein [Candidatus Eisenbacteria bacterium]
MRPTGMIRPTALALSLLFLGAGAAAAFASAPVQATGDEHLNYMPSLLQREDGSFLIVYERLDQNFASGDLMAVESADGVGWSAPRVVVAGAANERHPSLVRKGDGTFLVYYLSDATGSYDIRFADSPDGVVWTERGPVDLGWSGEDLVNPTVSLEPDGSLVMSYDRLSAGGYVAHSADGAVWDKDKTSVSDGSLNRIMRHADGTYVLSYQRRTGWPWEPTKIDVFTKTSPDRITWSAENRVTTNQNDHDSFPVELAEGEYGLYYAESSGGAPYDLMRRTSPDGVNWGPAEPLHPYAGWDTQPHPVRLLSGGVGLAWARGPEQDDTEVWFALFDPPTSVASPSPVRPPARLLAGPNPFRNGLELRLEGSVSRARSAAIYDPAGRLIRDWNPAPPCPILWDGTDRAGRSVADGVYLIRVETEEMVLTGRVIRIR